METILCPNPKNYQLYPGGFKARCIGCWLEKVCEYKEYVELRRRMGLIEKREIFLSSDGRLCITEETKDGVRPVDVTDEVARILLGKVLKDNISLQEKKDSQNAIILNGERYDLVEADIEACKNCDLDKFCDKFKDAICNVFSGDKQGLIFKKKE